MVIGMREGLMDSVEQDTVWSRVGCIMRNWTTLIVLLCLLGIFLITPFTRSIGISISGIVLFFLLIAGIVHSTQAVRSIRYMSGKDIFYILLSSVLFIIFSGFYLSRYSFIPTWDSAFYWSETLRFNNVLWDAPHAAMNQMLDSVNNSDYNQLLCWVMSFPVRVFPSWTATFFIELILSIIPASLLLSSFIYNLIPNDSTTGKASVSIPIIYIFVLLTPTALRPIFSGYLDAVGYLLLIAVLVSLFDESMPKRKLGSILIGFGLIGVFLIRRWFVFAVIGLSVSVSIYWMIKLFRIDVNKRRTVLFKGLVSSCALLVVGASIPLAIFWQFVQRSFGGDYSDSYRSWTMFSSYTEKIFDLISQVGTLFVIVSVVLVTYFLYSSVRKNRKRNAKYISTLIIVLSGYCGLAISLFLFWRIQDFSPQHWYIAMPFIMFSVVVPLFAAIGSSAKMNKQIAVILSLTLSIFNFFISFSVIPVGDVIGSMFTPVIQRPIQFDGVGEQGRLIEYLKDRTNGKDLVYFAAASSDLNTSLPAMYYSPGSAEGPFPVAGADVDSRDGFNPAFFDARFVVTASPVAVHMSKPNEQVVVTLNSLVTKRNSFIGKHFNKLQSFKFGETRTVTVYEKKTNFERNDIQKLKLHFIELYPDMNALFRDRFDKYILDHSQSLR